MEMSRYKENTGWINSDSEPDPSIPEAKSEIPAG